MARSLPGTVLVEGREFIYVENPTGRGFSHLMGEILASPDAPLPQSGGALEEKTRITLTDKTSLLAVSFKGDLPGWRNKIVCYCQGAGRKWGVVRGQTLVVSDGTEVPLADCVVEFVA